MSRPKSIETEDILAIARDVFLAEGGLGSTKEIARRAGISEPALFKRFGTKNALFFAALAPPKADVAAIFAPAEAEKDPQRALHLLARGLLSYYRLAIPRMLPLINHPAVGPEVLRKRINDVGAFHLDVVLASYLKAQHVAGRIHAPNIQAATGLLVAMLHAIVVFEAMGVHGGRLPERALAAMLDTLWSGFAPKARARPWKRR